MSFNIRRRIHPSICRQSVCRDEGKCYPFPVFAALHCWSSFRWVYQMGLGCQSVYAVAAVGGCSGGLISRRKIYVFIRCSETQMQLLTILPQLVKNTFTNLRTTTDSTCEECCINSWVIVGVQIVGLPLNLCCDKMWHTEATTIFWAQSVGER